MAANGTVSAIPGGSDPNTIPDISSARILIADDEPPIRKMLERVLSGEGYTVVCASDGAQAQAALAEEDFDLVMSDIEMPRMDGMALLKLVRQHDEDLPMILFTAKPTMSSGIGAIELHATGYLPKPLRPQTIREEVARALALRRLAVARRHAHQLVSSHEEQPEDRVRGELGAQYDRALAGMLMHAQPIVDWNERRVFGYEALVRTTEPSIPHPGALLDAAERLDRLHELGTTIRRKCAEAAASLEDGQLLFVNLHSADLMDEDLFDPSSPLASIGSRVVLEITERAHLHGVPDAEHRVARLRQMGFRVAIDDIGAGYSGLNSFAMLKPDLVKLDMALVRDIDKDPVRQRVTAMLLNLTQDLGIRAVGEGVETAAELRTLADLGCPLFQGYLLSRPGLPFPTPDYPAI